MVYRLQNLCLRRRDQIPTIGNVLLFYFFLDSVGGFVMCLLFIHWYTRVSFIWIAFGKASYII